ncbi:uncharacterized protein AMSG_04194 [Thecamonas trahens ATCC 50062]|uniref:Uncharacterized protein n=1 Tax=Thecamonas trahens ATCC 50062 TaxID=461836 RepID=A0A0L0D6X1_THETB|nr:hypothetical protein AMSG_04194 [Thecamonas trahens ATCC 50062]KNC47960.1 hypothetical protein AMSG_04194 [Thecamonas trahens ATCC 50062]|eukprot:XP_013758977.1 hypothetical protein AMSG_04194 [Thecamonas trahens ATCC 50062]
MTDAAATALSEEHARIEQYHARYPSSLSFGNVADDRSFRTRVAELDLEHLLDDCYQLERALLPDMSPLVVQADVLRNEVAWAGKRRYELDADMPALIATFLKQYSRMLDVKEARHHARWASFDVPADKLSELMPVFRARLASIANERQAVLDMLARLEPQIAARERALGLGATPATSTSTSRSPSRSTGGGDEAATPRTPDRPTPSLDAAGSSSSPAKAGLATPGGAGAEAGSASASARAPPVVVEEAELMMYLRWLVHHNRISSRIHRLLAKATWLTHSQRTSMFEDAHELLRTSRLAAVIKHTFTLSETERHEHLINAHSMPLMITHRAHMDAQLAELRDFWELDVNLEGMDGHEFLWIANKKFQTVFVLQEVDAYFPAYDASVKFAQLHLEEKFSFDKLAVPQRVADSLTIDENTVHVKTADWLDDVPFTPTPEPTQLQQAARIFGSVDIHPGLQAEAANLAMGDVEETAKRLRRLMEDHTRRALGLSIVDGGGSSGARVRYDNTEYTLQPPTPPPQGALDQDSHNFLAPSKLLSFYYLRHIRARQQRLELLHLLNYLRAVERRLTVDARAMASERVGSGSGADDAAGIDSFVVRNASGEHVSTGALHVMPPNLDEPPTRAHTGRWATHLRVLDSSGVYVMYDAALTDLSNIEEELVAVGSHYMSRDADARFEAQSGRRGGGRAGAGSGTNAEHGGSGPEDGADKLATVDALAVLGDLYESELWFTQAKAELVNAYLHIYECTPDPEGVAKVAQVIVDLLASRPDLDMDAEYFAESYAASIVNVELHTRLISEMTDALIRDERQYVAFVHSEANAVGTSMPGFPDDVAARHAYIHVTPTTPTALHPFEFVPHLYELTRLPALAARIHSVLTEFYTQLAPGSHVILKKLLVEWALLEEEERAHDQLDDALSMLGGTLCDDAARLETIVRSVSADATAQQAKAMESLSSGEADRNRLGGLGSSTKDLLRLSRARRAANKSSMFSVASLVRNAIELVRLRDGLLEALYETEILATLYRNQSRLLGHDLDKNVMKQFSFKTDASETVESDAVDPTEVVSTTLDLQMQLAVGEFDTSFASFDFSTVAGIKRLINEDGLVALRRALQVQLVEKTLLTAAVLSNQAVLDPIIGAHMLRRHELLGRRFAVKMKEKLAATEDAVSLLDLSVAGGAAAAAARVADAEKREDHELIRTKHQELAMVSQDFFSVHNVKLQARKTVLAAYLEKYGYILRTAKPDDVPDKLRQLKSELIASYSSDVVLAVYPVLLRAQIKDVVSRVRATVSSWSGNRDYDVFTLGTLQDDINAAAKASARGVQLIGCEQTLASFASSSMDFMTNTFGAGTEGSRNFGGSLSIRDAIPFLSPSMVACGVGTDGTSQDALVGMPTSGTESDRKFFTDDGSALVNVWYLPTPRGVSYLLAHAPQAVEVVGLTRALRIFHAMEGLLALLSFYSRLGLSDAHYNDASLGHSTALEELHSLRTQMTRLSQPDDPDAVYRFFKAQRAKWSLHFTLAMRRALASFLERANMGPVARLRWYLPHVEDGQDEWIPNVAAKDLDLVSILEPSDASSAPHASVVAAAAAAALENGGSGSDSQAASLSAFSCLESTLALVPDAVESMATSQLVSLGPRAVVQSAVLSGVSLEAGLEPMVPAAYLRYGPLAGTAHGSSLSKLGHVLVGLHEADRRYVLKEFDLLQHELDDALASSHIYVTSQPVEAVSLQLVYLRKGTVVTNLKSQFLLLALGRGPLATAAEYVDLKAAYHSMIVPKVLLLARAAGHWLPQHDLELGAGIGEASPSMEELEQVVPRKFLLDAQLDLLVEALEEVLIRKQAAELRGVQATLQATLDGSSRFATSEASAALLSHEISDSDYGTKLGLVRELMDTFTLHGSRVEPSGSGDAASSGAQIEVTESSIVIPTRVFQQAMDEFAGRVHTWGAERNERQAVAEAQFVEQLRHRLYVAEQDKRHLELLRADDEKKIKTRVQVEVADKGYELIRQISHIYRELARFKEAMEAQAVQIRDEVKQEYDDLVHDLYTQYISTRANFEEYRNFLYQEIQNELHVVKQDSMKKLLNISQLPSQERKRVQQLADLEEDMHKLKTVSTNLEKTVLKLKTMHTLKEIALRQTFEKKIRDEQRERVKKTKKLFEIRETMEQDKEMLTQLLATTQNALSNAEAEVETLRKNLELQQRNKKSLVHWKVTKSHLLDSLQAKVDRYERWGNIDVDKLLLELDRKDGELVELRDKVARMERVVELDGRRRARALGKLKSQLELERSLKEQAFEEVEGLRALAMDANAQASLPLERAAWKQKYDALLEDVQAVRHENEVLRSTLNQLAALPGGLTRPVASPGSPSGAAGPYVSPDQLRPLSAASDSGQGSSRVPRRPPSTASGGSRASSRPASRTSSAGSVPLRMAAPRGSQRR